MKKWLREPIIHFLLIGLLLYFIINLLRPSETGEDLTITLTSGQVSGLADQFSNTWMRPPTETELNALIDRYFRNEVAYREAMKLGLEQNDSVIQQRLRMKLELLLDNMTSLAVPSDPVLSAFLQENAERFTEDPIVSFYQVYLNPDKHADFDADAAAIITRLNQGEDPEELGDPTIIGMAFNQVSKHNIGREFGEAFADQLIELETGRWIGPIFSGLGAHVVIVTNRQEARLPELSEIRPAVEREWMAIRQKELKDAAYANLMEQYEFIVDRPGDPE